MSTKDTTQNATFPLVVNTAEAAKALGRSVQTLRFWACSGKGPIRPVRVNRTGGPLAWRGADILRLLNGGADEVEKQN